MFTCVFISGFLTGVAIGRDKRDLMSFACMFTGLFFLVIARASLSI